MNAKENLLRAIRHDAPQWVPSGMESVVTVAPPFVTRPAQAAGLDAWGCSWNMAEGGTYPAPRDYVCTDIHAWREQIEFPDLDACDWASLTRSVRDVDRETRLVSGFVELTLFERSYLLMGLENALMAYMTDTEEMGELLSAITDFNIEVISRMHEAANLDMVWYGDDWGSQEQLLLPPEIWRATVGRHTRRAYAAMKERGIIINQHSCGRIESILPDVIEMGADIWNPCQPCNDLADLKRRFAGRITFCGGIDSQHVLDRPGVTTDEVRTEVRKRIDELAAGGGYISEPSHSVRYDPMVIDAMRDEIERYGRKFYRPPSVPDAVGSPMPLASSSTRM